MPSWCQELAAGDQFSFSNDSIPSVELDGGCACWSASVKNGGFTLGAWAQFVDCSNPDHDHLKRLSNSREGSAILPATQLSSPNHLPMSKVHAMTRYKKEMLDSLEDVPECAYELSLKDLVVDLPRMVKAGQEYSPTRDRSRKGASSSKGGRKEKVQKQRSSRCTIKGFFLKIFFPVPPKRNRSIGSSRDGSNSGNNSNKSTKPLMNDGGKGGAAKRAQRKRSGKQQQPAVLEMDHSRRSRGCCHLFQNSKNQSSMA
ncbi:Uncharacterized protein M6B38_211875 [Iris pallida]|uniref:Uncharacterized protein n=1 Tax=Iris pallida TaxID=29817 RepID=A0AAX6E2Y1_IRIPA|nr:Uncharacterized protein M6B38_211875 [Iris pallida]